MTRRQFVKLSLGLAGAYVAGRVTYSVGWEKYDLRLTRWTVPLRRLPVGLSGLRVALFSDVHLNQAIPQEYVLHALDVIGRLGADLVVFAGDLLSDRLRYLPPYQGAFTGITAPFGKYAVLGNRDYQGRRSEPLIAFLEDTGWQVLRNENRRLPGSARAWMVGIDDPVSGRDDVERAVAGIPDEAFRLFVAHSPDVIGPVAQHGGDLLLAGHTHGGQIVLPFVGAPWVPSEYSSTYAWGMFDHGLMRMVVTRGVGVVPPRLRFNCPPEVVLLTLVRDPQFPYRDGKTHGCGPWMTRAR